MAGSAGALPIILAQLDRMTFRSPAALFVIYHRLPGLRFHLEDFARACASPIQAASAGARVHGAAVYYPKDDQDLEVTAGRLVVSPPGGRNHPNIDRLLESLAQAYGQRLVAVLLSGMASDGVRGLQAVRAAGGHILVQSPGSARSPELPAAALAAGLGDGGLDLPELHRTIDEALAPGGQPEAALASKATASRRAGAGPRRPPTH